MHIGGRRTASLRETDKAPNEFILDELGECGRQKPANGTIMARHPYSAYATADVHIQRLKDILGSEL
jgi:hypothetical protein